MGEFGPWHWAIVAIVFLALFGYKKLPDATRSIGRSLRIFKSEMKGMHDDDPDEKPADKPRAETPAVIEGQAVQAAAPKPAPASAEAASEPSNVPPPPSGS